MHAIAQILQVMREIVGVMTLGLEARDINIFAMGNPRDCTLEFFGGGELVDSHKSCDLELQSLCKFRLAHGGSLVEVAKPVTDQPGAVAKIRLQQALQFAEVGKANRFAIAANAGLADANFLGDGRRGLKRQAIDIV
ncbi:hypothetical protein [Rhizobium sp. RAF56]|uniref:hypothetical protein n=1 Tax=Rhizobium sp. RAF56 TaxID=3233062 RepID=UPI003F9B5CE2